MKDILKERLVESIRVQFGIETLDETIPIKDQIPAGMDKVDAVCLQLVIENAVGPQIPDNFTVTGDETVEKLIQNISDALGNANADEVN